jgi:hypothetical protein
MQHGPISPLTLASGLGYNGATTAGACRYIRALYARNLSPRRTARALRLPR